MMLLWRSRSCCCPFGLPVTPKRWTFKQQTTSSRRSNTFPCAPTRTYKWLMAFSQVAYGQVRERRPLTAYVTAWVCQLRTLSCLFCVSDQCLQRTVRTQCETLKTEYLMELPEVYTMNSGTPFKNWILDGITWSVHYEFRHPNVFEPIIDHCGPRLYAMTVLRENCLAVASRCLWLRWQV